MAEKMKALIVGVTGQDGAHLAKLLHDDGCEVYGGFRRETSNKTWRLDFLGITSKVNLVEFDLGESHGAIEILREIQPDEIYLLAGHSMVADSFKHPGVTLRINELGALNFLEAVRLVSPRSRLFFASSSEAFGVCPEGQRLNETSQYLPSNPYGISKLAAQHLVRLYRETYGLFACSGILFNHEGPLRARQFVTRKITYNIARLKLFGGTPMELGDLGAARDWGSAHDYVLAMRAMLAMDQPKDLVVSTGQLTTVRDFLTVAARCAGFEPVFSGSGLHEVCVDDKSGLRIAQVNSRYLRKHGTPPLVGDSSQIAALTGWRPKRSLSDLVHEMVEADLHRLQQGVTNV